MKFRKRPVIIDAVQWDGKSAALIGEICPEPLDLFTLDGLGGLLIRTTEGTMRVDPGDWIIRGVTGEFYPCKPAVFDATYEAVT